MTVRARVTRHARGGTADIRNRTGRAREARRHVGSTRRTGRSCSACEARGGGRGSACVPTCRTLPASAGSAVRRKSATDTILTDAGVHCAHDTARATGAALHACASQCIAVGPCGALRARRLPSRTRHPARHARLTRGDQRYALDRAEATDRARRARGVELVKVPASSALEAQGRALARGELTRGAIVASTRAGACVELTHRARRARARIAVARVRREATCHALDALGLTRQVAVLPDGAIDTRAE